MYVIHTHMLNGVLHSTLYLFVIDRCILIIVMICDLLMERFFMIRILVSSSFKIEMKHICHKLNNFLCLLINKIVYIIVIYNPKFRGSVNE